MKGLPNFILLWIYVKSGSLQTLQSLLCSCALEIPLEVYLLPSKQQRNVRPRTAFAWHTFYSGCCFISSCWCIWCVPRRVHACHCMGGGSLLSLGVAETKLSPSVSCIKCFYPLVHLDSPIANIFLLKNIFPCNISWSYSYFPLSNSSQILLTSLPTQHHFYSLSLSNKNKANQTLKININDR